MSRPTSFVSIVIVNWNSGRQLFDAIASLSMSDSGYVDMVVVVDNASSDDSLTRLQKLVNLPFALHIINNVNNLGFGYACNQGAQYAKSEYLLFLNPDCQVYEGAIAAAVAFLENNQVSKYGICGVKLINEEDKVARSCTYFPNLSSMMCDTIGLTRFFPKVGYFMHDWDHLDSRDVDHVIGAFYLIKHDVFTLLKGFDERFFVYLEDLDLSLRANKMGWKTHYLADVKSFHAGGGTSNQVKARRLFYSVRSRILYAFKHFSLPAALLVLLASLFVEPLSRTIQALLRGSFSAFKETWSGFLMIYCWLPRWLFKGETR